MNRLHIAVATDSNYIKQTVTACKSVADNNLMDFDEIVIHALISSLESELSTFFQETLESFGLRVKLYNVSGISEKLGKIVPPTISTSSYSRLFLSSLLDKSVDRLIYMDVDSIVAGSFSDLWNLKIDGKSIAGVLDDTGFASKERVGLASTSPYINAGFLLINLKYWRERGIEQKFIVFLKSHDGKVYHHDQGIINAVCNDSMLILPPRYNMTSNLYTKHFDEFHQTPFYSKDEIDSGKTNPVFIHFTPGVVNRPWFRNCRHPMRLLYLEYRAKTPYSNEELPYDNRPFKLKFLAWCYFHCQPAYYLILKIRGKISDKL